MGALIGACALNRANTVLTESSFRQPVVLLMVVRHVLGMLLESVVDVRCPAFWKTGQKEVGKASENTALVPARIFEFWQWLDRFLYQEIQRRMVLVLSYSFFIIIFLFIYLFFFC